MFSPLVEQAMRLAARAHCDHCRKGSDLPYLTHPASVALILVKAGFDDDEILAAALLHDVVEDTDYSLEQLAAEFPPSVVDYVAALTERKRDSAGRKRKWQERKDDHIEQVASAPLEARAIVLADKLHNLATMLYDLQAGDDLWSRFHASPRQTLDYLCRMIDQAAQDDPPLQLLAHRCRNLLTRLQAAVKPDQ